MKGTVCIDGVPATAAKRSAESTYIPQVMKLASMNLYKGTDLVADFIFNVQEDHFIPSLTCFEVLMVAARLRGLIASSITQVVDGNLRSMGLQRARNTQVGVFLQDLPCGPRLQSTTSYLHSTDGICADLLSGGRSSTWWPENKRNLWR